MGRKAERVGEPLDAGAMHRSHGDAQGGAGADGLTRWFEAGEPEAAPPRRDRRRLWAAPLLVAAALLVVLADDLILRALLPLGLAGAALLIVRGQRSPAADAPRARVKRRGLALCGARLVFHGGAGAAPLRVLDADQPFGVTLLASPRRERLVTLISSSAGTFYVGAAFDAVARRTFGDLVDRATIVASDEVGLEAIGPDGEPLVLAPATLAALIEELSTRSPGCLDRLFLTDARGGALALGPREAREGRELRAGGRTFDLGATLEWRAFVFQEAIGQAVALYQATWVRQGTSEIVLVCLLPAISPLPEGEGVALSSLDRSALRDLRLMQGTPEDPPQAELRVAVDRLVMLPIRSALDKAPRPAAQPPRARA